MMLMAIWSLRQLGHSLGLVLYKSSPTGDPPPSGVMRAYSPGVYELKV